MSNPPLSNLAPALIPVIDIGPLRDGSNPMHVAQALHQASRDIGFIYISNHGIDLNLLADARQQALEFFRQPAPIKQALGISNKHRGFLSMGQARMQADKLPDLKESFIWGIEDAQGQTKEDHPLRGSNRWPQELPALRATALQFFDQADQVSRLLLQGFALGLGLPPQHFLGTCSLPMSRAAFVYYPAQDSQQTTEQFGVAPHTDFGVLTVLCQDDVGGLQVQNAQGQWVNAPPIPGTLVVNVGDLLSRWTNGEYRSTPHRVINTSGKERLSLVLAFDPDPETRIDAREVFPDREPLEPAISCGDYLIWRFGKSFNYRADAVQSPAAM
jgi:isopenicillin N synthase-like dioxygenase